MDLNDLLRKKGIDPALALIVRHRPYEPEFNKIFPLIAIQREDLFNTYQQSQTLKLEKVMVALAGSGFLVSCIAHGSGRALFIGLYKIREANLITFDQYWAKPQHIEMRGLGFTGLTPDRKECFWFELERQDFYREWAGRMINDWPPPDRSWWRRAHRNDMAIESVLERPVTDQPLMDWREISFSWSQLKVLPDAWKAKLGEWRALYYIQDRSDGKGYVGSAYGTANLFGRWANYGATGHGGNTLLRKRDPSNFQFSILERVSPDMEAEEVIRLESTWKQRLNTRAPYGLNDN